MKRAPEKAPQPLLVSSFISLFHTPQLSRVEIKPSSEADAKIQEECAPGKPYSVFTTDNAVNGTSGLSKPGGAAKSASMGQKPPSATPVCRYVNVQLCGTVPSCGAKGLQAVVLLENPRGEALLHLDGLLHQVNQ